MVDSTECVPPPLQAPVPPVRVRGLLAGRFLNKTVIANNQYNDGTDSGIWITEADATSFIGTGLSYDVVVANNTLRNMGLNGIHISAAIKFVTAAANIVVGASFADTTHNAIRIDGGANGVNVIGNQARDGGATNKPTVGIIATSTCSDVILSSNVSYGTSATHNNGASGASSVAIWGGVGSPSTTGVGAPIGSIFLRSDGGALTTLYVKESGTSATGWVAK